ncbi:Copine [Entamoeba marina]
MGNKSGKPHRLEEEKFVKRAFDAKFETQDELVTAIRNAGVESSNLIIGIDFTYSNYDTGAKSFNGKCLHSISPTEMNPYEKVIGIMGRTLAPFDDDNLIPVFGFGDSKTLGNDVFDLNPDNIPFVGIENALQMYRKRVGSIITSEEETKQTIELASNYPLSIICFDNFNFINYTEICEGKVENPDMAFLCAALCEIPDQYKAIKALKYISE